MRFDVKHMLQYLSVRALHNESYTCQDYVAPRRSPTAQSWVQVWVDLAIMMSQEEIAKSSLSTTCSERLPGRANPNSDDARPMRTSERAESVNLNPA
eukprot:2791325-Amphidinium_carterae.1